MRESKFTSYDDLPLMLSAPEELPLHIGKELPL